jgi:hypothetical protein
MLCEVENKVERYLNGADTMRRKKVRFGSPSCTAPSLVSSNTAVPHSSHTCNFSDAYFSMSKSLSAPPSSSHCASMKA